MSHGGYNDYLDVLDVDEIVNVACSECGILTFRKNLNDNEIAEVCRWVGLHAPNSKPAPVGENGKPQISVDGFDAMVFVTITEFPKFFEEHMLAMVWRN